MGDYSNFQSEYNRIVGGSNKVQGDIRRQTNRTIANANANAAAAKKSTSVTPIFSPSTISTPSTPSYTSSTIIGGNIGSGNATTTPTSTGSSTGFGTVLAWVASAAIAASVFLSDNDSPSQPKATSPAKPSTPALSAEQLALNAKFPSIALFTNRKGGFFPAIDPDPELAKKTAFEKCTENSSGCTIFEQTVAGEASCISYLSVSNERYTNVTKWKKVTSEPDPAPLKNLCFSEFFRLKDETGKEPHDRMQCEWVNVSCNQSFPNYSREEEYRKDYERRKQIQDNAPK